MLNFLTKQFNNTRTLGSNAELLAQYFLEKNKLKLIAKNYHCRAGEIDLIMKDIDTLVFVEVRYRKSTKFGEAVATIGPKKQYKIIQAARHYLHQNQLTESIQSRFDVIGVGITPERNIKTQDVHFDWIKNAFH